MNIETISHRDRARPFLWVGARPTGAITDFRSDDFQK